MTANLAAPSVFPEAHPTRGRDLTQEPASAAKEIGMEGRSGTALFSTLRTIRRAYNGKRGKTVRVPRYRKLLTCGAIVTLFAVMIMAVPSVVAQTQYIEATPGYVNLGMTTSVVVTAPAAGSYSLVVQQPNGTQSVLPFAPTSAGEILNATYGNSSAGFDAIVNQVGTYSVFLEQGSAVVSSASFYATNKLSVSMDMVNGGTCSYIAGATRGTKMFPRFAITFASDGAPVTNLDPGVYVTYTLPDGTKTNASWDGFAHMFVGKVQPGWNYTSVGPWNPSAVVHDAAGNSATYTYTGSPYVISPVQLSTSIRVIDTASGQLATSLQNGHGVTIEATVSYPTNAEPVPGFVGLLNSTRGGVVTAEVGWGYYNTTSNTFGGSNPGGLIGTVHLTYSSENGTWTGQFTPASLPTLAKGSAYEVVVTSKDSASPANTGFGTYDLSPAGSSTVVSSITTATSVQTVESIPTAVYAALVILLIVGLLIGYIVRIPR